MTEPRKTNVPAIPALGDPSKPEAVGRCVAALREAVEVGYGRRGDPEDRFVTLRELQAIGIVSGKGGTITGAGARIPGRPGDGAELIRPPVDDGETDLTVPPAPTGVRARPVATNSIAVTWDPPSYGNHAFAEVFADVAPRTTLAAMIASTAGWQQTSPVRSTNPHERFIGGASGVVFVHEFDEPGTDLPGGNALDQALNPQSRYYWVRFVSRAGVPGPFAPLSVGAFGRPRLDAGRVLDAMVSNVSSTTIYNNLRRLLGGGSTEAELNRIDDAGGLAKLTTETLDQTWSVRMQSTGGGVINSAGFGLGLTTDRDTGSAISTFIVNANQFAIMGPTTAAAQVRQLTVSGSAPFQTGTITFQNAASESGNAIALPAAVAAAFADLATTDPVGNPKPPVVFMASEDPDAPAAIAGLAGRKFRVTAASASSISIASTDGLGIPSLTDVAVNRQWNLCIAGDASIPFIVDTTRNVVGIRGSLIVNGLISADQAEFGSLTAETGFIRHLATEVLRADLIVGSRIIAGISELASSGWRVELNAPNAPGGGGAFPIRYWNPSGTPGQNVGFSLDTQGNVAVGRNLSVGANAVIATTGGVLTSIGGTGAGGDGYALWVGPTGSYGTRGGSRTEGNGLFWIRSNGRAGFNAALFSGENPFEPPSTDGLISVRAERGGRPGRVFASALVTLAPDGNGTFDNTVLGVDLYLVEVSFSGPGAIPPSPFQLRSSLTPTSSMLSYLNNHVGIYTSRGVPPSIPGGALLASTQYDWRGSADIKNVSVMGSAVVPAGDYKVFVAIWRKQQDSNRLHAAWRADCFAMHVSGAASSSAPLDTPKNQGSGALWDIPPYTAPGGPPVGDPGQPPTIEP